MYQYFSDFEDVFKKKEKKETKSLGIRVVSYSQLPFKGFRTNSQEKRKPLQ